MIHIDSTSPPEALQQFASQVANIPPDVLHIINESFTDDKSGDFYEGLLAGLAFSYQLAGHRAGSDHIGAVAAVTAAKVLNHQKS